MGPRRAAGLEAGGKEGKLSGTSQVVKVAGVASFVATDVHVAACRREERQS
ncbi:hypothetical protein PtA15_16A332 [Puccinia triticina]|uniref:Uncharacterized protein n=1 Tax=Puccinia triticina TaxID=208348 RepID=A0ABY7D6M3_9BASI|nr:uncharacterized protein PtA15_16A332 [Puccinia triticina]WAQ92424.1 hypothetical protein PtA15_16A332 [Puccinia triticina]WAR64166.1 hypothetical protein PtB15_16B326 [Puccinia triticina]